MNTKVVVDRRNWLRGEGPKTSFLRRGCDGKMCCLGFAALALGISEAEITNISTFSEISPFNRERLKDFFFDKENIFEYEPELSDDIVSLMKVNDDKIEFEPEIDEEKDREDYIKFRGKLIGLDFEFVN